MYAADLRRSLHASVSTATRPYEQVPGSANALHRKMEESLHQNFVSRNYPIQASFNKLCREIIHDFDNCRDAGCEETDVSASLARSW